MTKHEGLTKDQHTIAEHRIKTSDGLHELYVQEWGNKKGFPIFFLHGGPGAGCNDKHKRRYDPKKHYVIFHDQRGTGNSTPKAELKNNQTSFLVEDIELIRNKLKLNKVSLNGGSWGSTLSLCYGIKYPENVASMLIDGVFLSTQEEIDWFEKAGYKRFFPEVWEMMIKGIPKNRLNNPGQYLAEQIKKGSKKAAYQYVEAEGRVLSLDDRAVAEKFDNDYDDTYAKIISSYISNRCYLAEDFIVNNSKKLKMPIYIIQGRYDMVCPPQNAYRLHKALPKSKLYWSLSGHRATDRSSDDILKTVRDLVY